MRHVKSVLAAGFMNGYRLTLGTATARFPPLSVGSGHVMSLNRWMGAQQGCHYSTTRPPFAQWGSGCATSSAPNFSLAEAGQPLLLPLLEVLLANRMLTNAKALRVKEKNAKRLRETNVDRKQPAADESRPRDTPKTRKRER
eukprot:Filipodium_phascolosomae@DN2338_c0_g1_i2.p1